MGQLSRKTSVKLSIVGSPPGVLHISGSPEGIARLQEEWAKVQSVSLFFLESVRYSSSFCASGNSNG